MPWSWSRQPSPNGEVRGIILNSLHPSPSTSFEPHSSLAGHSNPFYTLVILPLLYSLGYQRATLPTCCKSSTSFATLTQEAEALCLFSNTMAYSVLADGTPVTGNLIVTVRKVAAMDTALVAVKVVRREPIYTLPVEVVAWNN